MVTTLVATPDPPSYCTTCRHPMRAAGGWLVCEGCGNAHIISETAISPLHELVAVVADEWIAAQEAVLQARAMLWDAEQRIDRLEHEVYRPSICAELWERLSMDGLAWCCHGNPPTLMHLGHVFSVTSQDQYLSCYGDIRFQCSLHLANLRRRISQSEAIELVVAGYPDKREPITNPVLIPGELKQKYALPHWQLAFEIKRSAP